MCKKAIICLEYLSLVVFLIIGVPAILNYLLQCNSPIQIISDTDGTKVWLDFWAVYISALGTIVISLVSFYNNKRISEKDEREKIIAGKEQEYRNLEGDILSNENFHSTFRFYQLIKLVGNGRFSQAREVLDRWSLSLKEVSLKVNRYDFKNDVSFSAYALIVNEINEFVLFMVERATEMMEKREEENVRAKLDDWLSKNSSKWSVLFDKLMKEGLNLISKKRAEIVEIKWQRSKSIK